MRRRRRFSVPSVALLVLITSTLVYVVNSAPASAATTELYSWGNNATGQLGNGNTTNATTPQKVQLPSGISATAVAAGTNHSLAVGTDGKVYAWGNNTVGQFGNGTTTSSSTPVAITLPGGVSATAVAAGMEHSVALGSNGAVYDWGYNGFGQLGDGNTANSSTPVKVTLPAAAIAVAAGAEMSEALLSNGDLWTWGEGTNGALGNGNSTNHSSPVQATVSLVSAIAAGGQHTLLISVGIIYAFGYNGFGQLGDGSLNNRRNRMPVNMPAGVNGVAVAAGEDHSLAIGSNNKLYAWGYNGYGQLGNGTTVGSSNPALVNMPAGVTATSIAAGANSSYAIGSDGNLYAWGYNGLGELGDGATSNATTPVQVSLTPVAKPPNAVASGSSAEHAFAIAPPTPAPTTTTLSTSPSSVTYGQTVTITATLSRSDGGGTVQFLNGSNPIVGCSAVSPTLSGSTWQAQCATSFAAGSYSLTGDYTGDSLYAASNSSVLEFDGQPGAAGRHGVVGVEHLRHQPADDHAVILGVRER